MFAGHFLIFDKILNQVRNKRLTQFYCMKAVLCQFDYRIRDHKL